MEPLLTKINAPGFNSYDSLLGLVNDLHDDILTGASGIDEMLSDKKELKKISSKLKKLRTHNKLNTN